MELILYLYISLLIIFSVIYSAYLGIFISKLTRINNERNINNLPVSVIVPARNEEKNLSSCLESLLNQSYPKELYEIIVVDDDSDDNTATIVKLFQQRNSNVLLVSTSEIKTKLLSKVNALNCGLKEASNNIIFITDADCISPFEWIEEIVSLFTNNIGLICGFSAIIDKYEKSIWIKFQAIENIIFLSLCAGGISSKLVIGATGQNMAFKKEEFLKFGGFEIMEDISAGDDVILLNNWMELSKTAIKFCTSQGSIIKVKPVRNLKDLFNQHKRWLSVAPKLARKIKIFYLTITSFYLLIITGIILLCFFPQLLTLLTLSLLIKIIFELSITIKGLHFYNRFDLLPYYFFYELIQIPLIFIAGLAATFTKVSWKKRSF